MNGDEALRGKTIVVIGGTSGIGLETARLSREMGADLIITARGRERLHRVGTELGARAVAFDAADAIAMEQFFADLPGAVDHVLLSGGGPYYAPFAEMDFDKARRSVDEHFWTLLQLARSVGRAIRPGGTLLFIGGTAGRAPSAGPLVTTLAVGLPALTKSLAIELAPIRVNALAAGFVDTPLSAAILGDQLDARRAQLRTTLPIQRVVEPSDIAALAVHLMTNTAITGATIDIDGGQQLIEM